MVGEGGYGHVYKARWMEADVAAKAFLLSCLSFVLSIMNISTIIIVISIICIIICIIIATIVIIIIIIIVIMRPRPSAITSGT